MEKSGVGGYYHVYNRGVLKTEIFLEERDWVRFLFLILYFQSDLIFYNLNRPVTYFVRHSMFNIDEEIMTKIIKARKIDLVAFSLMPNHFHLLIRNIRENGRSRYMQRVLNAYTKYFNAKYHRNGHLFQGRYKSVWVEDNEQLLYLSAYIHKHRSICSSAADYYKQNRWGKLLATEIILDQFVNGTDYKSWVKENPAKDPDYLSH